MNPPRRLVQITDLHICAAPGDILCSGVVTDESLRRVLGEILAREGPGTTVLASGDLVQDPVPQAYERLRNILADYPFGFHCLPGNHDDVELMQRFLVAPNLSTAGAARLDDWSLVLLDSSVPGMPHGRLGRAELERLRQQLSAVQTAHVLVALHHQPVAVHGPWMDRMMLADNAEFFDIIEASGLVRAVVFGHVHQEIDITRHGMRLLGSPSTCVQFLPRTLTMGLDSLAPAYRWLELAPDGRVDSGVVYLGEQPRLVNA